MGAKSSKTSLLEQIGNDISSGVEDDMIDMQMQYKIGSFKELRDKTLSQSTMVSSSTNESIKYEDLSQDFKENQIPGMSQEDINKESLLYKGLTRDEYKMIAIE